MITFELLFFSFGKCECNVGKRLIKQVHFSLNQIIKTENDACTKILTNQTDLVVFIIIDTFIGANLLLM